MQTTSLPPPPLLHDAFIIYSPLVALGSKKYLLDVYLLDVYLLSKTILIMHTTYHHRYITMHSFIHSPFIALVCKKLLVYDYFLSQTFLIMQTTYLPLPPLLHDAIIIHLFTHLLLFQYVRNSFLMTTFFHKNF